MAQKKTQIWDFHCPARLGRGEMKSRDYLRDRVTLNAQSTRHGARPGPKLTPSVHAASLRASWTIARGKTRGRKRKGLRHKKKCIWYVHM